MRKRFNFISVRRISKKKIRRFTIVSLCNTLFQKSINYHFNNNRYKSRTLLMVKSLLKDIKKLKIKQIPTILFCIPGSKLQWFK